jgi:aryl-alcohol dehydrogenase-like predicted oxidoreductase
MSSALALGLAALGRPAYLTLGRAGSLPTDRSAASMRARCHDVLDAAYDAGVRHVDAARSYGLAERFLADWLRERGHHDVEVSSKWGYRYVGGWRVDADVHEVKAHDLEQFSTQWAQTRELLGGVVSLYQVHSLTVGSPLLDDRPLLAALAALRDHGVRVGFSTSGPRQADAVRAATAVEIGGRRLFDACQSTWNLLEPSAGPALAEAHAAGLRVLVKEALANGRLAVDAPLPVRQAAERAGVGPDAIALAAALRQPWADRVLLGPASVEQLRSNLRALDLPTGALSGEADVGGLAEPPEAYWEHRSSLAWS